MLALGLLTVVRTDAQSPAPSWRDAPEFSRLFAPPTHRSAYRTMVTTTPIDAVMAAVLRDPRSLSAPGAWEIRPQNPWDAFGQAGVYPRSKIVRLYGSRRAAVARGPRGATGRVEESWTLISPYPDPTFTRLEPGTLLIVLTLP